MGEATMEPDFRDVPEPFRYSRAHSWPQPTGGVQSPPPAPMDPLRPPRSRLIVLVAGAAALGLLISGVVVTTVLDGDEDNVAVVTAPPPSPTVLASVLPEATDLSVPEATVPPSDAEEPSQAASPTEPAPPSASPPPEPERTPVPRDTATPRVTPTGPRPADGPLASYLLTAADVRGFAPGTWRVSLNAPTNPKARREKLVDCSGQADLVPHIDRHFKLPAAGGGIEANGPRVIQRLVRYDGDAGAKAVQGYRRVVAECPVRRTEGYAERWTIVRDTRTAFGDILVIRRMPQPKVPQGKSDFGNDYVVVRNRGVVLLADFRARARVRLSAAQTSKLTAAMVRKLCGGSTC